MEYRDIHGRFNLYNIIVGFYHHSCVAEIPVYELPEPSTFDDEINNILEVYWNVAPTRDWFICSIDVLNV
jgi:hypothetical protein